jgi:hypothetical protein
MNIDDTVEDRLADLQKIVNDKQWQHDLYTNPLFQQWAQEVDALAKDLLDCAALGRWDSSSKTIMHLKMLGLEPPKTPEQGLGLYIAFKAVVNFWSRNLDRLKDQSSSYERSKKEINELGRSSDLGTLRTVAQR